MNKSIKIWLNYVVGAALAIILFVIIYNDLSGKTEGLDIAKAWHQRRPDAYLIIGLLLLPLNLGLEIRKWKILAASVTGMTNRQATSSYLAGLAFSFFTPNRIGEYPGRILYLKQDNTVRLLSVSVLGAFAQLFAVLFFGLIGLLFFNYIHPGFWEKIILVAAAILTVALAWFYIRFEEWSPRLERIGWLRKFLTYKQLIRRFALKEQLIVLFISLLRFLVFTTQFLVLLYWLNVDVPVGEGFCLAALFFGAMAVIPSVAFAELGIRGKSAIFLFGMYSANHLGILSATTILWCINLALPAIVGSFLLIRMRLLR